MRKPAAAERAHSSTKATVAARGLRSGERGIITALLHCAARKRKEEIISQHIATFDWPTEKSINAECPTAAAGIHTTHVLLTPHIEFLASPLPQAAH